jgi:NADPH2:quinone reductase
VKAVRQDEFGPADVLVMAEVPDPEPGPGQVRMDVAAAGVHFIDTTIRAGRPGGPFPLPELPMTPGREVAGTVGALGPDVDPAWLGRPVVAHLGPAGGGYAERAVTDVTALHAVPDGASAVDAVAMVGTGRTALGVLEVAALDATDVVLVTAAAGGMGPLFVQAARRAGAAVVGLAGGVAKAEKVRGLGADLVVDYAEPGWADRVRESGLVPTALLDGVGGDLGRTALGLLGEGGRAILFGMASGTPTPSEGPDVDGRGLRVEWAIGPRIAARPGGLRGLAAAALEALARGELVPLVNPPFALADAAAAHRALETRATTGKVVLLP